MDNGRLFRAVVTAISIVICIWALRGLESRRGQHRIMPADTVQVDTHAEEQTDAAPAMHVDALPLVALDNTCFYPGTRDLSLCTGMLSGAPARDYRVSVKQGDALYINVEPRAEFVDLSFALFAADDRCVAGVDERGPGLPEVARLTDLESGEYVLVVSGYSHDCGPYELTVRSDAPSIARIVETTLLRGRNGTVVRWGTFAELDLKYFVLYRTDGDDRERVAVLRAHGSPAGFARYRYIDRAHQPDSTYEIEAVAHDGRIELVSISA